MQQFEIPGRLPALNDYTKACRTNRYMGNNMKREAMRTIVLAIKAARLKPVAGIVKVCFLWVEPNKKRDKDNIAFAKKFVLDALQEAGVIKGDGWKDVLGFADDFAVDKANPRIIVELEEVL